MAKFPGEEFRSSSCGDDTEGTWKQHRQSSNSGPFVYTTSDGVHHSVFTSSSETTYVNMPNTENIQLGGGVQYVYNTKKKNRKSSKETRDREAELTKSTRQPTKDELDNICVNVGKSWKKLASQLGLSRGEIDNIAIDYHVHGLYEMAWQTLRKWGQRQASGGQVCELARALYHIGKEDLALNLK